MSSHRQRQKTCWIVCAALVLPIGAPGRVNAQILLTERAQPENRLLLSAGWESTWLLRLGYARSLADAAAADVTWSVPVSIGNPFAGGRVELGFNPLITAGNGLGAAASFRSGIAWSSDALGARASWTAGVLLAPW